MKNFAGIIALGAALLVCAPAAAAADPLIVTGPSFVSWTADSGTFHFTGGGFSFDMNDFGANRLNIPVIAGGGCLGSDRYGSATACLAGDAVDMSARTPGMVQSFLGTAHYGGQTYSQVEYRVSFNFAAGTLTFPDSDTDVFLMAPFTFTGELLGVSRGQRLFDVTLAGEGTATRPFRLTDDGRRFHFDGKTTYQFSDPPSATPEPASMLLMATGAAGLFVRRRKPRK